jgi:hypothetical protein
MLLEAVHVRNDDAVKTASAQSQRVIHAFLNHGELALMPARPPGNSEPHQLSGSFGPAASYIKQSPQQRWSSAATKKEKSDFKTTDPKVHRSFWP